MSDKKHDTTAREGHATEGQTDRQQRLQELSQRLIAILQNPETPERLFNDIAENLVDLVSPSHVALAELLPRYLGGEGITPPAAATEATPAAGTPDITAGAPAAGAPTETNDAWFKPLTPEQALALVNRLLAQDDDAQALALVALVGSIAYDKDWARRDNITLQVIDRAYSTTMHFSHNATAFAQ